jgi:hypothetical protein
MGASDPSSPSFCDDNSSYDQQTPQYWDLVAEEARGRGEYDEAIRIRLEYELPLYEQRGEGTQATMNYRMAVEVFDQLGDPQLSQYGRETLAEILSEPR